MARQGKAFLFNFLLLLFFYPFLLVEALDAEVVYVVEDELVTFVTKLTAFGQGLSFNNSHDFGGFDFCLKGRSFSHALG